MKRFCIILILSVLSFSAVGQSLPIKFLGLSVDGPKSSMIQELRKKGFNYNSDYDRLEGTFNGRESYVYIHDNREKVDRIMVVDAILLSRGEVKKRFNLLLSQFLANGKYCPSPSNSEIPDDEDISYEMTVNDKEYTASFYPKVTAEGVDESFKQRVISEIVDEVKQSVESGEFQNPTEERMQTMIGLRVLRKSIELAEGVVWFSIERLDGEYYIALFYDNFHNQANGEDL